MSFGQITNPLLSGILIFAVPQGHQIDQPSRSLMTRVRRFIGTQPRTVSVGGTRSSGNKSVCLLSPGPIRQSSQGPEVVLVDSSPDLVLGSQLNEVEISSGSKVLWNQMATSKRPVDGRILWPIEPINPDKSCN